jgi:hypothetical protein
VIDGYGAPAALGSLTFAVFLAAMTPGPLVRPGLSSTARGRTPTVAILRRVASPGSAAAVVFGRALAVAMAGAALWGLGHVPRDSPSA